MGDDRTGTGTRSLFATQLRHDLSEGFPLLTTKRVWFKGVAEELLWFLSGSTNAHVLASKGVHIWDNWATEDGELGPVYGSQWTSWQCNDGSSFNQIDYVINLIKTNPKSRRIIFQGWNPSVLPDESISPQENVKKGNMAITCCHLLYQFYVSNGKLSLQIYVRSQDTLLGCPFNLASGALLTHMIAQQCNLDVGEIVLTQGDCHLYNNHIDQVNTQLEREPKTLPVLNILRKPDSIYDYKYEDFKIIGYDPHPPIKAPISV